MRANVVEIPINERAFPRKKQLDLGLDLGLREAVADYLRHRWPSGTAKFAARAYDLSLDRAREAVGARASITTIERIIKVGGWPALLAIGARVIGQNIDHFILAQRTAHAETDARLGALFGGWFPLSADRDPDPSDLAPALGEQGRSFRDRRTQGQGRRAPERVRP